MQLNNRAIRSVGTALVAFGSSGSVTALPTCDNRGHGSGDEGSDG